MSPAPIADPSQANAEGHQSATPFAEFGAAAQTANID